MDLYFSQRWQTEDCHGLNVKSLQWIAGGQDERCELHRHRQTRVAISYFARCIAIMCFGSQSSIAVFCGSGSWSGKSKLTPKSGNISRLWVSSSGLLLL